MSAGSVRAGKAYVEVGSNTNALVRGLDAAQKRLTAFGAAVTKIGLGITASMAAVFAPIAISALDAASNAQEVQNRFNSIFGSMATSVDAFAKETADAIGRPLTEVRKSLSVYGGFFSGLGMGQQEVAKLSKEMTTLALDFASFHNISDEESIGRFLSAMSGSGEVLDQFGVNIREAAIEQELLRQGINKSAQEATEAEKVMARMGIIEQAMGKQGAIGDATKTAGSYENLKKRIKGISDDIQESIGKALLPVAEKFMTKIIEIGNHVATWAKENQTLIGSIFKVAGIVAGAGVAIASVGSAFLVAGVAIKAVIAGFGIASTVFSAILSPIGLVGVAIAGVATAFFTMTEAGGVAMERLASFFKSAKADTQAAMKGIGDAMAAGDIKLAGEILWTSLKVVWQRGVATIIDVWEGLKFNLVSTWLGVVNTLQSWWESCVYGVEVAWTETINFLGSAWQSFAGGVKSIWNQTTNAVAKGMNWLHSKWDSSLDLDELNKATQQATDDKETEWAQEDAKATTDRDASREKRLSDAAQKYEQNMQQIQNDLNTGVAGAWDVANAGIDGANAELERLVSERNKLLTKAANAAYDANPGTGIWKQAFGGMHDQMKLAMKSIDTEALKTGAAAASGAKTSSRGTFNAAGAMQSLQGSKSSKAIEQNTKKSAEHLERIVREMTTRGEGGIYFA